VIGEVIRLSPPPKPHPGDLVEVYFNLHKKIFSVRLVKTRRVVLHTDSIILKDVTFKVSEAGRQRVLKEKRKNVHAWARGTFVEAGGCDLAVWPGKVVRVKYNPYKYDTFVTDFGPIHTASQAVLSLTYIPKNEYDRRAGYHIVPEMIVPREEDLDTRGYG